MMVVKGEQWATNTYSGVWTCDWTLVTKLMRSLKKSSSGRRICHIHKIPRTLLQLIPEVSIKVLGFANPCPIQVVPPNEGSLMVCMYLQSSAVLLLPS